MKWVVRWAPFALASMMLAIFVAGLLRPSDRIIASGLVGSPVPSIALGPAVAGVSGITDAQFADEKPHLLNVFASWCVPCVAEIPMLMRLKAQGIEIDAIAIHDRPEDIARFLAANGNPYARIGLDIDGRAQLALGSSGVPETFIIDRRGIIRHQHIGVITENDLPIILASWEEQK